MSFLTQGKWNNPALVLGFDPREVVRRAVLNGTLPAPAAEPIKRGPGRPAKNLSQAARTDAMRAASARHHARSKGETIPLRVVHRPELAGLKGRAYHRAYQKLYKAGLLKPAPKQLTP